jgi:hypothetical protein
VAEPFLGAFIVFVLLALAGWFGWKQVMVLRNRAELDNATPEDRRYLSRQAWRRLVGCALMVVLAGLLAGWYLLGFHDFANQLFLRPETADGRTVQTPQEQQTLRYCVYYFIAALVVLLGMLGVAALDILSIRSYALRHHRQIMADRRAMIERQVARMRQQGNGREE